MRPFHDPVSRVYTVGLRQRLGHLKEEASEAVTTVPTAVTADISADADTETNGSGASGEEPRAATPVESVDQDGEEDIPAEEEGPVKAGPVEGAG